MLTFGYICVIIYENNEERHYKGDKNELIEYEGVRTLGSYLSFPFPFRVRVFDVCAAQEVIYTCVIIIGQFNQNISGNITFACPRTQS